MVDLGWLVVRDHTELVLQNRKQQVVQLLLSSAIDMGIWDESHNNQMHLNGGNPLMIFFCPLLPLSSAVFISNGNADSLRLSLSA
ncbi:hypothetical protein ACP70R_003964 [Stipagrostis hirtigluma subsp. patula]